MALVEYEERGSVAVLTLNRPEKRNAIDGAVAREMEAAIDRMETAAHVCVGILRAAVGGERPVFCAGHDLSTIGAPDDESITEKGGFAGIVTRDRDKPIIAAVDGLATSGGLEIVLACDMVVASTRSVFSLAETRWNLVPGGGGLFRLGRIVGRMVAMDMLLTGNPLDARRAFDLGLVSRLADVDDLDTTAFDVATTIAAHGPQAIRLSRRIASQAEVAGDDEAWQLTVDALRTVTSSADAMEGIRAFAERRQPKWVGA